ncbi:MAG: hypothetical protein WCH37_07715 [Synechococcaceae cyanobacterium ELA182]
MLLLSQSVTAREVGVGMPGAAAQKTLVTGLKEGQGRLWSELVMVGI